MTEVEYVQNSKQGRGKSLYRHAVFHAKRPKTTLLNICDFTLLGYMLLGHTIYQGINNIIPSCDSDVNKMAVKTTQMLG